MTLTVEGDPVTIADFHDLLFIDQMSRFNSFVDRSVPEERREEVLWARDLMLQVHGGQPSLPNGNLEASHMLEVAYRLGHVMKDPDADWIVAALLHDAVENNPEALIPDELDMSVATDEEIQGHSLMGIGRLTNLKVKKLVKAWTNPRFGPLLETAGVNPEDDGFAELKIVLYADKIFDEVEKDPQFAVLKSQDILSNWRTALDHQETDPARAAKMLSKYAAGARALLPTLTDRSISLNMTPAAREETIVRLQELAGLTAA